MKISYSRESLLNSVGMHWYKWKQDFFIRVTDRQVRNSDASWKPHISKSQSHSLQNWAADVRIYSWKFEFFSTVLHFAENIINAFPQHDGVSMTVRNKESSDQLFLQFSISPNESGLHFFSNRHTGFTGHNLFVPNLRLSLQKINWGVRPLPVALWQYGKMRFFSSLSLSHSLLALCIWNEWQRSWVVLCPALQCLPFVIQNSTMSAKVLYMVWPRFPFPNGCQQTISQEQ